MFQRNILLTLGFDFICSIPILTFAHLTKAISVYFKASLALVLM